MKAMAMERELRERGHDVAREVGITVTYGGEALGTQRLDMIVDGKLVVETKSTYELHRAAPRQLYNYLRATNLDVGLLLHFGPEPRFQRLIDTYKRRHPLTPSHLDEPFVIDARNAQGRRALAGPPSSPSP